MQTNQRKVVVIDNQKMCNTVYKGLMQTYTKAQLAELCLDFMTTEQVIRWYDLLK